MLLVCLLLQKFNSDWTQAAALGSAAHPGLHHTLTGDIRLHKNFHSRYLPTNRDLIVYLPPGYDKSPAQRYPVLYMQDGQNIFDAATCFCPGVERHLDERAQALIVARAIQPLIIVGINSTELERIDEYTPTRACAMNRGGDADLYGRMLVDEVKPFIDHEYRTLKSRDNTALGGSSLGGLVSLYVGFKYAQTFGKLAVTSPAAYWDDEMIIRYVKASTPKRRPQVFMSVGSGEPQIFRSSTRDLRKALAAKGWREGNDLSYSEPAVSEHRPGSWTPGVDLLLKFLFPPKVANHSR